ncbi:MAG: hypothetical protein ACLUJC_04455 [Clostridia bacterium]
MKKTADKETLGLAVRNLKENETIWIEFEAQPQEPQKEVESDSLHLALQTLELGESLLVRLNEAYE